MQDFIRDGVDGFLVGVGRRGRQQMATLQHISPSALIEVINRTNMLTDETLDHMAKESRKSWEENDKFFKDIFPQVIEEVERWSK